MCDQHARLQYIEGKLDSCMKNLFPSETPTQMSGDEEEDTEIMSTEVEAVALTTEESIALIIEVVESEPLVSSHLRLFLYYR